MAFPVVRALALLGAAAGIAHSDDGQKDPNTALLLSAGGTLTSAALIVTGWQMGRPGDHALSDNLVNAGLVTSLVTPSLGEWYAGRFLTVGMVIRAVSGAAILGGVVSGVCFGGCDGMTYNHWAPPVIAVGLLGYVGGTVWDLVTARSIVDGYNTSHRIRTAIAPTVLKTPSGRGVMGVGLGMSF